jgi:hypothetical protein
MTSHEVISMPSTASSHVIPPIPSHGAGVTWLANSQQGEEEEEEVTIQLYNFTTFQTCDLSTHLSGLTTGDPRVVCIFGVDFSVAIIIVAPSQAVPPLGIPIFYRGGRNHDRSR